MLLFFSETKLKITLKQPLKNWLKELVLNEKRKIGTVNIVFLNDEKLLILNKQFLNHNTFTDIITFDYSEKNVLHGDICISVERVKENAKKYNSSFEEELRRVMAHGIFHLCGYKDKQKEEQQQMKQKEEGALLLFRKKYNK